MIFKNAYISVLGIYGQVVNTEVPAMPLKCWITYCKFVKLPTMQDAYVIILFSYTWNNFLPWESIPFPG